MRVLVTGAAGFIGAAVCHRLLERGDEVVGVDNLSDYYDVRLKQARLATLQDNPGFTFIRLDLAGRPECARFFEDQRPARVVHLAAQAGVRHSLVNPSAYADANLNGFLNVLEGCRHSKVEHLVYASSSSVYGANRKLPFSVEDCVDHPLSLYAASKKANELMAHSYSHLFRIPTTGLRFFTVYGPWGRPDMALFQFTRNILAGQPIDLFNEGKHQRDFTYIDDIVEGVTRALDRPATSDRTWSGNAPKVASSDAPYRIYNIGGGSPIWLEELISVLEKAIGLPAKRNLLPMQAGDLLETFADTSALERDTGFRPRVSIQEGVPRFVDWYRKYFGV